MEKAGRNDPCPCGSGKKFKKCCFEKMKHKRFTAELIDPEKVLKAQKIGTSFFHSKVAPPEPPADEKNIVM